MLLFICISCSNKEVFDIPQEKNISPVTLNNLNEESIYIGAQEVTNKSVTVSWNPAANQENVENGLEYKVVYSTENNIKTIEEAEQNGNTAMNWTSMSNPGIKNTRSSGKKYSFTVKGLKEGMNYFFNILVKDQTGKKQAYQSFKTSTRGISSCSYTDTTPPTRPSQRYFHLVRATSSSIQVSFQRARDNCTSFENIRYRVSYTKYRTTDFEEGRANYYPIYDKNLFPDRYKGGGWYILNTSGVYLQGLESGTTYFIRVEMSDEAGNKNYYLQTFRTQVLNNNSIMQVSTKVNTSKSKYIKLNCPATMGLSESNIECSLTFHNLNMSNFSGYRAIRYRTKYSDAVSELKVPNSDFNFPTFKIYGTLYQMGLTMFMQD